MDYCSTKIPALRALRFKVGAGIFRHWRVTWQPLVPSTMAYMNMNTKYLKTAAKAAVFVTVLAWGVNLRAATPATTQTSSSSVAVQNQFQTVAFSDSAEAGMLQNAYLILATGDHDYKGHRVRAMHQIEAAAKLLGVTLSGDAKDKQPQPLSDAKLREAQGLLQNVLGAAEVKNQERVTKHITNAINQINTALSIR